MIEFLRAIAPYLILITAAVLASAVWIGRRRPSASADPFSQPFGEMPGFTAEQLDRLARLPTPPHFDPLRRSFAVRDRLKREAQPLLRFRQSNSDGLTAVTRSDQRAASAGVFFHPLGPSAVVARKFFRWCRHG